jgi:Na+:H+ antiporter, NhaA family
VEKFIKGFKYAIRVNRIPNVLRNLLQDEAISGKLIIVAALLALIVANSPLHNLYDALWHTNLSIGFGNSVLSLDLRDWINEALMAIFFLVVGLEIKRELVHGELRKFRTALLPIGAAIGGMAVPALLYAAFNHGTSGSHGWAIPMATDIALALGLLSLLGNRIPASVKLFLLTMAIADDIGAIAVIAVFYNTNIQIMALSLVGISVLVLIGLRRSRLLTMPLFIIFGILVWLAVYYSGIHASIAGAIIGLAAPLSVVNSRRRSIAERTELFMIPISTFLVIPLFVLANVGISLSFGLLTDTTYLSVSVGIIVGLIVGKAVGVIGVSWLLVKLGLADLPVGAHRRHMIGIGLLAGIGFTVSVFVTELAFIGNNQLIETAKIAVLIGSFISAVLGYAVLRTIRRS